MSPSTKTAPRKGSLPSWLVLGAFGLLATGAGFYLPHNLLPAENIPPAPPAAGPAPAPPAAAAPARPDAAVNGLPYTPPALPELPSMRAMFVRLVLGTAAVLVLCVLTLWVGKRWIRPYAIPDSSGRQLRVIETLPLGGRCSVFLLQAGKARVLAGLDGSGLKTLLALPESFDAALDAYDAAADSQAHPSGPRPEAG